MKSNHVVVITVLGIAIIGSSIAPSAYRPALFHDFDTADHVIGYTALSAAVAYIVRSQHILLLIVTLVCLAASLELVQALIPCRDASFRDLFGSIVGILIGTTSGRLLMWITDWRMSPRGR